MYRAAEKGFVALVALSVFTVFVAPKEDHHVVAGIESILREKGLWGQLCLLEVLRHLHVSVCALALLVLSTHLRREGWRWQMVPAFLAHLLSWVSLSSPVFEAIATLGGTDKMTRSILSGLQLALLLAAFVLCTLMPIARLPRPQGLYGVGTLLLHWTDHSRKETWRGSPFEHREIMAQIWYPAREQCSTTPSGPYWDTTYVTPAIARRFGFPGWFLSHMRHVRANAVPQADPAPSSPPHHGFPVVLFSHGHGGCRHQNTVLCEYLASYGYVVCAVDHAHDAAATVLPDGRIVRYLADPPEGIADGSEEMWHFRHAHLQTRVADLRFALDCLHKMNQGDMTGSFVASPPPLLKGKLCLDRVGALGHSFGAATAVMAAIEDPRVKACCGLDAWFFPMARPLPTLRRPLLLINSERWQWPVNLKRIRTLCRTHAGGPRVCHQFTLQGSSHHNFNDLPLHLPFLSKCLGLCGPIASEHGMELVNRFTCTFLDVHVADRFDTKSDGYQMLVGQRHVPPDMLYVDATTKDESENDGISGNQLPREIVV